MKRREFFSAIGAGLGIPLLPTDVCITDQDSGKTKVMRDGKVIWFVDVSRVNIHDLISPHRPGKVVRCDGDPHECVMVYKYG